MLSLVLVGSYVIGVLMYMRSIIGIMSTMMMIEEDTTKAEMLKRIDGHFS